MEWVKVTEAMPPLDKRVITSDGENIAIGTLKGYYRGNKSDPESKLFPEWTSTSGVFNVKFWAKIPEPPKE